MASPLAKMVRGAVAGAAATVPMSAVMLAAQRLGAVGTQPPEAIVDTALDEVDVEVDEQTSDALSVAAHFGFGATIGALFGLLRAATGHRGDARVVGAAYASVVWAVSYQGWIPRFGALPRASDDREDRQISMVAAHLLYGAVLGWLTQPIRR